MHVVIAGAGIIGLATAWRAQAEGLTVTLVDPAPASGASGVAAGLLTPVTDLTRHDPALLALCLESHRAYPAFAAELQEETGQSTGFHRGGFLEAARDPQDLDHLDDLRRFRASLGIPAEPLTGAECRSYEPQLAPTVLGGLLVPDEGSVDPRRLTAALLAAVERRGGVLLRQQAVEILIDGRGAYGLRLADGSEVRGDAVLLAAGCWTHLLEGPPPGAVPEIRPVKGQVLRLRADSAYLRHTVRGWLGGSSVYLAPRADGELVVGATYEECGYDTVPTGDGLAQLLGSVRTLLPGSGRLAFAGTSAGLRPASPDGLPVLGRTPVPGLLVASGHFRIGIGLAPVTATAMTRVLLGGELPDVAAPFAAQRFTQPVA